MKYRILKMAVMIGLMASSSLAVAEGKFVYKQPLQGVDASPTFGMTSAEKQAWQEEQETIAMCAEEYKESTTSYSREAGNQSYVRLMSVSLTTYNRYEDEYYLNGTRVYFYGRYSGGGSTPRISGSKTGYSIGEQKDYEVTGSLNYRHRYYEIIHNIKTEKYDWCVSNGYQTAS